jgi:hypothetical protein
VGAWWAAGRRRDPNGFAAVSTESVEWRRWMHSLLWNGAVFNWNGYFQFAPRSIAIEPLHLSAIYRTVLDFNLINSILNWLFKFKIFHNYPWKNQLTPLWYHHLFILVIGL